MTTNEEKIARAAMFYGREKLGETQNGDNIWRQFLDSRTLSTLEAEKPPEPQTPITAGLHGDSVVISHCSGCTDPRSEGTHQMGTVEHPGAAPVQPADPDLTRNLADLAEAMDPEKTEEIIGKSAEPQPPSKTTVQSKFKCRCNCHESWWVEQGHKPHTDCLECQHVLLDEAEKLTPVQALGFKKRPNIEGYLCASKK